MLKEPRAPTEAERLLREVFAKTCKNAEPRPDGVLLHPTDWIALNDSIDTYLGNQND